ncbi:MAG: cation:proton antiporter [Actinomycetota bacterium]|nr:cation:proton antiporter [Actinomycetota bacterium]
MAGVGTVITAAVLTLTLSGLLGMELSAAVLLAVMLAPTDPVCVLAIFKEHDVGHGWAPSWRASPSSTTPWPSSCS